MLKTITPPSTPLLIKDLGYIVPNKLSKQKKRYGIYKCQCGNEFKTQSKSILSGATKSCGCYKKQKLSITMTTHGKIKHRIYQTWCNIKQRCNNPKSKDYKDYGGRGILICDEWHNDFKAFYDWAMENGYADNLEIDRRDNDGNYEPSNCRFVSETVQARQKRIISSNNTTGYRGVSFNKSQQKFVSYIKVNGKMKHLGYFLTAIEAATKYDNYVVENMLEHTINGV